MKLICYLSNGYPTIEASIRMAKDYVDAGCDIIEFDFPSRDPYLESELIGGRMKEALKACDDYEKYMEGMVTIKEQNPGTDFIVLAYENTVIELGVETYAKFLLENGFENIIYIGAEHDDIKNQLIDLGIKVSTYVQFHMLEEEIAAAKQANGFVYMQAKPTTGNLNPDYPTLKDCIQKLRDSGIDREIYVGVGVYSSADIAEAKEAGADAAFVGSRILNLQDDIPEMKRTIAKLKAAAL